MLHVITTADLFIELDPDYHSNWHTVYTSLVLSCHAVILSRLHRHVKKQLSSLLTHGAAELLFLHRDGEFVCDGDG